MNDSGATSTVPAEKSPTPEPRTMAAAAAEPAPLSGATLALGTVALSLATFMNVLDTSIANVSLPAIAGDLGVSLAQHFALRSSHRAAGLVRREPDLLRILLGQVIVEGQIGGQTAVWLMRRTEPDNSKERLAGFRGAVDEANRFSDDDLRAFPWENFRRATVAG